jgi:hypothetical protein
MIHPSFEQYGKYTSSLSFIIYKNEKLTRFIYFHLVQIVKVLKNVLLKKPFCNEKD